jgi:hypothetical protein
MSAFRDALAVAGFVLAASCASTNFDGPDGDRRLFEARCSACHVPPARESHDVAEWPKILDIMAPRARLTAAERGRVLSYVTER